MTLAERKHVAELCRANWRGKVVVGVSSTAVPDSLDLLKHASEQVTTVSKVRKLSIASYVVRHLYAIFQILSVVLLFSSKQNHHAKPAGLCLLTVTIPLHVAYQSLQLLRCSSVKSTKWAGYCM